MWIQVRGTGRETGGGARGGIGEGDWEGWIGGGAGKQVGWAGQVGDTRYKLVSRSPDPFLSGYCAITGWKGSGSFLKCNCSMSVGTWTRCESNTSLMSYHKSS